MTHALKTVQPFFRDVVDGTKTFEVRKNDRSFKVGDRLLLQEWLPKEEKYTGQEWEGEITYMLDHADFCKKGFVVLGIKERSNES